MSLASLSNVTVQYGTRLVLDSVSFGIQPGMRLGVIGGNGSGKSTILQLLCGELEPHAGQVSIAGTARIWHLRQSADTGAVRETPLARALSLRPELAGIYRRLTRLQQTDGPDAVHAAEYALEVARYSEAGGYDFEQEALRQLAGLGIGEDLAGRPLCKLSGGEQARAALAVALLSSADLLLLDEPDNHLDIDGLSWLEQALARYPGTVVLVSHDRELLDRVATHVLEVGDGAVWLEQGGVSEFLDRRQARLAAAGREQEVRRKRIARLTDDIRRTEQEGRRFDNLSTSDHFRRIGKKIAKTALVRKARLERERTAEQELLDSLPREAGRISLGITAQRSASHLLMLRDVSFGYDGRQVLDRISLELQRGQRLALIGPNGCGKTTLLRIALGELRPEDGEAWRSASPLFYCDQGQAGLDPELPALEMLRRATGCSRNTGHHLLARMNLKNREALKPVFALSGGERTRLLLAVLANQPAGLLVLDEPTNHLDLPSMEALEQALVGFSGGVLLVSHDRRLVRNVATEVYELRDGRLAACTS